MHAHTHARIESDDDDEEEEECEGHSCTYTQSGLSKSNGKIDIDDMLANNEKQAKEDLKKIEAQEPAKKKAFVRVMSCVHSCTHVCMFACTDL